MNISSVYFPNEFKIGNKKLKNTTSCKNVFDSVVINKKTVGKTSNNKCKKILFALISFLLAINIKIPGNNPNTTNPNNLSKSDLKQLYSFGKIVDFLDGSSSKDGIIGDTEQGKVADCWLLSTINSMKTTEVGKEIISNMFEYNKDETIVHLKGVGDYSITDDEIKIGKIRHSKGDDDMLLIELAVEKALADYNKNELELPDSVITPQLGGDNSFSTLNLGSQDAAMYILTGQTPTYSMVNNNEQEVDYVLHLLQNNKKSDFILTASIESGDKYVKDISDEMINLKGHHAYSILDVKDNYVTVVNPEDSSIEYNISIEEFKNIFDSITYMNLN